MEMRTFITREEALAQKWRSYIRINSWNGYDDDGEFPFSYVKIGTGDWKARCDLSNGPCIAIGGASEDMMLQWASSCYNQTDFGMGTRRINKWHYAAVDYPYRKKGVFGSQSTELLSIINNQLTNEWNYGPHGYTESFGAFKEYADAKEFVYYMADKFELSIIKPSRIRAM